MNRYKSLEKRKSEFKDKIIERKNGEIEVLKELVNELQINCNDKDNIINAVDGFHKELNDIMKDLKEYREKYNALVKEVFEMRQVLNKTVFKGRWKIIKWLMK